MYITTVKFVTIAIGENVVAFVRENYIQNIRMMERKLHYVNFITKSMRNF